MRYGGESMRRRTVFDLAREYVETHSRPFGDGSGGVIVWHCYTGHEHTDQPYYSTQEMLRVADWMMSSRAQEICGD